MQDRVPMKTEACKAPITGTQNLCTRDKGHDGEHRCKAYDVDRRTQMNIENKMINAHKEGRVDVLRPMP